MRQIQELAQELVQRADSLEAGTGLDEREMWLQHPCTKILKSRIESDIYGIFMLWAGGAYSTEESVDATSQNQAKARGQVAALTDILEHIDILGNKSDDSN